MKKTLKKMIAVLLLAGTMMSMLCFNTMAAYYGISGSCKGSTTFDVTTKGGIGQSITIKPSKPGQLWIDKGRSWGYFLESWANYQITVKRIKGNGRSVPNDYIYGKYPVKIWLGSNSTYRITVKPAPTSYPASQWKKTSFWELASGFGIKSVVHR